MVFLYPKALSQHASTLFFVTSKASASTNVSQHAIAAMAHHGLASPVRFSDTTRGVVSPALSSPIEVASVSLRRLPWSDSAGGSLMQVKTEEHEEAMASHQSLPPSAPSAVEEPPPASSEEAGVTAAEENEDLALSSPSPDQTPPGQRRTADMLQAIRDGTFDYNCSASEQSRWIRAQCKLERLELEAKAALVAESGGEKSPARKWATSVLSPCRSAPSPSDEDVLRVLREVDEEDRAGLLVAADPLEPLEPLEPLKPPSAGIANWLAIRDIEEDQAAGDERPEEDDEQAPTNDAEAQPLEEEEEE